MMHPALTSHIASDVRECQGAGTTGQNHQDPHSFRGMEDVCILDVIVSVVDRISWLRLALSWSSCGPVDVRVARGT